MFPGRIEPGAVLDVEAADLDQDGAPDLVLGAHTAFEVARGDGTGSFFKPTVHWLGTGGVINDVVVADIDGDGLQDVLVAASYGSLLASRALPGLEFAPPVSTSLTHVARHLRAADLDLDGFLDLAVATLDDRFAVYRGDGTFTFQVVATAGSAGEGWSDIALGDFDGDGWEDVAHLSSERGELSWYRTDGLDTLRPIGALKMPGARSLDAGDLDGDGRDDLVVSLDEVERVQVLLGTGSGGFLSGASQRAPSAPAFTRLVDLDADGDLDAAIAGATLFGTVATLVGDGMGNLAPPLEQDSLVLPARLAFADFDRDGVAEIAANQAVMGSVRILDSLQDDPSDTWLLTDSFQGSVCLADDFNGDGMLDLIAKTSEFGSAWLVYHGDGNGGFELVQTIPSPLSTAALGDLTCDGHVDLAVVQQDHVSVRLGLSWGFFGQEAYVVDMQETPASLEVKDLDLDGQVDLVSGLPDGFGVWINSCPSGGIETATRHGLGQVMATYDLAVGDVVGDARLDVVASGPTLRVFEHDPTGFPLVTTQTEPPHLARIVLDDLNGDGRLDLLGIRQDQDALAVRPGAGNGAFGEAVTSPANDSSLWGRPSIADYDQDGLRDVVTTSLGGARPIHLHRGIDPLAFQRAESYQGGGSFVSADFDADGRIDLVTSLFGQIAFLRNRSRPGEPAYPMLFGAGCPGSAGASPSLSVSMSGTSGSWTALEVIGDQAGAPGVLVLGPTQASVPLGGGCVLHAAPPWITAAFVLDGNEAFQATFDALPSGASTPAVVQAFVLDPAASTGFAATNGVSLLVP